MSKNIGNLQDKSGNLLSPNIIETVTNDNGTALKFPDGTMICYGSGHGVNGDFSTVALPSSFVDTTYKVSACVIADNYGYVRTVQIKAKTLSTMTVFATWTQLDNHSSSGVGSDRFDYIAIGRWK